MGEASVKDLNPWKNLIGDGGPGGKGLSSRLAGVIGQPMPVYPGVLRAGASPMEKFAKQLAGRRATSGQPQAWKDAGQYAQSQDPRAMAAMMAQQSFSQQPGQNTPPHPGVNSFIDTYLNAYPVGWNPYQSQQPGNTAAPPWAQPQPGPPGYPPGSGPGGSPLPPWLPGGP